MPQQQLCGGNTGAKETDDDAAAEPRTAASAEVSLVDVHGPYLTYDARADIELAGGASRHSTRRAVVDLRLVDDIPGEDVARMLGTTPGNVAVMLHRAKQQLRGCMDSGGDPPPPARGGRRERDDARRRA